MSLKDRLRFTHSGRDDSITVSVYHRGRGAGRPARLAPLARVRRADLRELCDALHDLADELDRKDTTS